MISDAGAVSSSSEAGGGSGVNSLTSVTSSSSSQRRDVRSLRASAGGQQLLQTAASQPAIFATENSTVIIAQIGSTTNLPCIVKKFGNGVVSTFFDLPSLDIIYESVCECVLFLCNIILDSIYGADCVVLCRRKYNYA
jgi:hypothetical protein